MKTYEYKFESLNGSTIEGTLLSSQSELPKSAKLIDCHYDLNFTLHNVYKSFGKTIKIFIVKPKY